MPEQPRIRFSSIISDPKLYLEEIFQLHKDAKHIPTSGEIEIKNDFVDSNFSYFLVEKGLFLFSFRSFSPVDAEYEFISNPNAQYFTLLFYFTEKRSKNPIYVKTDETFISSDQISFFFNGKLSAEIFLKAKQNAFGFRLDIHKDWIMNNVDVKNLPPNSDLLSILNLKRNVYFQTESNHYINLVKEILNDFNATNATVKHLKIKSGIYNIIALYLEEIIQSSSNSIQKTGELTAALNYLQRNIHKEFQGNILLSELCHLSESSFLKKFKTAFGLAPAQYFKNLKMKEALRLLQVGETVKDVTFKMGYKDQSAFGRMFKLHFGESPASFVKK